MDTDDRGQTIVVRLKRIEESPLTVMDFFKRTAAVPFSRAQYYRYLKKAREGGEQSLYERKHTGGKRKLSVEAASSGVGEAGEGQTAD